MKADNFPELIRKMAWMLVALALALSGSLWFIRTSSAVNLERPYLGVTSGCEEEALFSVWKVAHGFAAYNSPWLPPFSHSYFGWLFYESYGLWAKIWLKLGGLEYVWLPTVARSLTLLGLFVCIGLFFRLLQHGPKEFLPAPAIYTFGFAALVFINPLFDWWSFTVRPDIWALVFELGALLAAFRYAATQRAVHLAAIGLLAFLAWSFRPTNISILVAVGLWLLLDRRWKPLLSLVVGMALAFAVAIGLLGENFIDSVFLANAVSGEILLGQALRIARSALTKNPLLLLSTVVTVGLLWQSGKWWKKSCFRLAFLAALTSFGVAFFFSAKVGAGFNYYFPPSAMMCLFVWMVLGSGKFPMNWLNLFLGTGAAGVAGACVLILTGVSGNRWHLPDDRIYQLKKLRTEWQEPIFCTDRIMNLPWILGSGPNSMVFGYAYDPMLKARPEKFVAGTLSSFLQEGKFGTVLVFSHNTSFQPEPADMIAYRRTRTADGLEVFEK